jgi:threonine synthase
VLCITGHGLKTQEAVAGHCGAPRLIGPHLSEFAAVLETETETKGK